MFFVSLRFLTPPLAEFSLRQLVEKIFLGDFGKRFSKRKKQASAPKLLVKQTARKIARKIIKESKEKKIKVSKRKLLYEIEILLYVVIIELF